MSAQRVQNRLLEIKLERELETRIINVARAVYGACFHEFTVVTSVNNFGLQKAKCFGLRNSTPHQLELLYEAGTQAYGDAWEALDQLLKSVRRDLEQSSQHVGVGLVWSRRH